MIEKRYNDDWAKDKSREVVKRTLEKTLMTFRKPKQLRVLCFPGIDAQEITQVYDALGIPRKNIVGLEMDSEIAEEIRKKNLGINLVNARAEDYIATHPIDFDVVSLDYTSPINWDEINAIHTLLSGQQQRSFVLHVANSIKRDAHSDEIYKSGIMTLDAAVSRYDDEKRFETFDTMIGMTRDFKDKKESGEARNFEKGHGYSRLVRGLFSGMGKISRDSRYLLETEGKPVEAILKLERAIRFLANPQNMWQVKYHVEEEMRRQLPETDRFYNFRVDEQKPISCIPDGFLAGLIATTVLRNFAMWRNEHIPIPHQSEEARTEFTKFLTLATTILQKDSNLFINVAENTYAYISESGCPMIGDVYFLRKPVYSIRAAERALTHIGYPHGFEMRDFPKFCKDFKEFVEATDDILKERLKINGGVGYKPREFLGNSSKPVLTKRKFLEELDAGHDAEYVREHYRGWRNKPLAQWQAHHTMGTYSAPLENDIGGEEDSDLEKITKDEAIDLLSSGISVDEIRSAYPTSFTVPQLRAYKAHITMGTYQTQGVV